MRALPLALCLPLVLHGASRAQSSPPPDILLRGNHEDNGFGASVALAGDVNGDGVPDLVVGAEAFDDLHVAQGRVFIFYGPFGSTINFTQADATLTGEGLLDGFGNSVAGVGDVNDDGFDDVLVGARSNDTPGIQAGRAYLFHGPLTGNRAAVSADAIISGDAFDEVGWSVARAGDVNSDGFDDLLVGAWMSGNGKAVLFHGPLSGARTIGQANATIEGVSFNEQLGEAVASADMNDDGVSDLIIGAPRPPLNGQGTGRVYVFFGPVVGLHPATDADVLISGEAINDEFGTAVAGAGDVNGDGADDLLVGAHQLFREGDGRAYVFYGPLTAGAVSASDAGAILLGEPPLIPGEEDLFGEAVASAGDANGDGFGDVIVAASNNRAGGLRAGRAYLFHGPLAGTIPAAAADRMFTGSAQDLLGASLAFGGDLNGDGADEVLIGAPAVFESGVTEYAGAYFGTVPTAGEGGSDRIAVDALLSPAVPNPVRGEARLTLEVAQAQPVVVHAYDAMGRRVRVLLDGTVRAGERRTLVIDTGSLSAGTYSIRAIGETFSVERVLVVVR